MLRPILRTVAGLVVATAIFFAAGEGLARLFGLVDRLNGYARQTFTAGPDADLPYRLRPGVETRMAGSVARVNALGLRGPEVAAVPAPGVFRVLVLGDSVVFGQGVADDATFPAALGRALGAARGGAVEALNAGVQGYDAVAEAAFLEGPGLALVPAAVVVGTSLNDYDTAPAYDATGVLTRRAPNGAAPGRLARSEFLLLLRWLRAWSRGELMTQMLARAGDGKPAPAADGVADAVDRAVAAEHLRFYRDPDPARWARLRGAFVRLRDAATRAGIPLVVALFPESYQVGSEPGDLEPQRRLGALCTELGMRCIDLVPAFRAAGGDLFQDAQHPNARGLAVAADAIAAAMAR